MASLCDPIRLPDAYPPFPTHGYRKCLFGGISPAGRRGSLQLTRCRSHHVAADTPRVRTAVSDSFRRPLLPSRVIDRLTLPAGSGERISGHGYGADGPDVFRKTALFVTKILQGGNPANMPVEQPTKFELIVNLITAKALWIMVPETFLVRADDVIE
jgi:hypothetical protein